MNGTTKRAVLIGGGLAILLAVGLWLALADSGEESVDPLGPDNAHLRTPGQNSPPGPGPGGERHDANGDSRTGATQPEPGEKKLELLVRCVNSKGEVLPTAQVGVTGPDGFSKFSMRRPDKQHAFRDLEPGTWEIRTYAEGFLDSGQTVQLEQESTQVELQLKQAPLFPVRFLTPAGENAIDVLDSLESSPLRGSDLFVIATRSRPEATIPRLAPGARPQYGIGLYHNLASIVPGQSAIPHPGEGYAGVLELKDAPPAFISCVLRETVLETVQINSTTASDLVFTVVPEQLQANLAAATVLVLDARTREPIENVQITCDDSGIADSGQDGSSIDENGRILFEQRYPGWATLRAWAPGYEAVQKSVLLESGQRKDLGTILLEAELSLTGQVTNQAGEGVRSVIFARDENWNQADGPPEIGHTLGSSGNDGKLILNHLGKRTYSLHVQARGYRPRFLELDLRSSVPEALNLVLEPGTKTTLNSAYDADLTHRVTLHDAQGNLCFSEFIPGRRTRETWLAAGEYRLTLQHGERELSRTTVVITDTSSVLTLN